MFVNNSADISETQKDTFLKQSVDVESKERRSSNTGKIVNSKIYLPFKYVTIYYLAMFNLFHKDVFIVNRCIVHYLVTRK